MTRGTVPRPEHFRGGRFASVFAGAAAARPRRGGGRVAGRFEAQCAGRRVFARRRAHAAGRLGGGGEVCGGWRCRTRSNVGASGAPCGPGPGEASGSSCGGRCSDAGSRGAIGGRGCRRHGKTFTRCDRSAGDDRGRPASRDRHCGATGGKSAGDLAGGAASAPGPPEKALRPGWLLTTVLRPRSRKVLGFPRESLRSELDPSARALSTIISPALAARMACPSQLGFSRAP